MTARIEDYGLIGDCETAALVSRDGSIDWLCWPRFDSGACFAALLGTADNGRWRIAPLKSDPRITRRYRPDTLILETNYATADGEVTLIDFLALRGRASHLVRLIVGKRGTVAMKSELIIRCDYGASIPWVKRTSDGDVLAISGPDMLILRTTVPIHGEGLTTVGEFTVSEGQAVPFVLMYAPSHLQPPEPVDAQDALQRTQTFWEEWAAAHRSTGPYADAVSRSLITLKALTFAPTGGIVAAPTTSLPEWIGGSRNWDYRFCWLRDATLTLLAFMNAGYYEEARCWRDWLLRAAAGSPAQLQIMYGLAGERRLPEWEVPWLSGYGGSKPVRIGNAASNQLQIDIFGEVMDALLDDARRLFGRLLSLRNDLGLLSEEYDPPSNRLLGNFPQAFSHIALINTAHNIVHVVKPCHQRSGRFGHIVRREATE